MHLVHRADPIHQIFSTKFKVKFYDESGHNKHKNNHINLVFLQKIS
jgi:hypothetical protein